MCALLSVPILEGVIFKDFIIGGVAIGSFWLMRKTMPRGKGQLYEKIIFVFSYLSSVFP